MNRSSELSHLICLGKLIVYVRLKGRYGNFFELHQPCRFCNSCLHLQVTCPCGDVPCAISVPGAKAVWSPCLVLVSLTDNTPSGRGRDKGLKFSVSQTLNCHEHLFMDWPRERLIAIVPPCVCLQQHFSNPCEQITFLFICRCP